VVTHVTHPSQRRPYGAAMLVVPTLAMLLAGMAGGPVGDFLALALGGASTGALVSAWLSMIVAAAHRRQRQSRRDAFFSAELERWAPEGLAIGSATGLALAVLDAWVLA
jgi:hypothetical protein